MNDRLQMGVVKIENVARHAVDEGGVHDVKSLSAIQQRGLRGAREGRERSDGDLHRLVTRSANCDADPVQKRPSAFLADISRKIVVCGRDKIMRERARDVFRRGGIRRTARRGLRSLGESRVRCRHCEGERRCRLHQSPAIHNDSRALRSKNMLLDEYPPSRSSALQRPHTPVSVAFASV